MAITEKAIANGTQWERTATGDDIPKLMGSLVKTGNEAYREAFHKNEGQFVRVSDPNGNPTQVHQRDLDAALQQGYGRTAVSPSIVMPEVPWERKVCGPGKHKFRYNKSTRQMEAV